jgi:hypothetical protein
MRNFVMHETGRIGVEICPAYLLHLHNTMKSSWRFEKHAENGQEKGRIILAKEICRICAGYEVKPSFKGIEQNIRLKI